MEPGKLGEPMQEKKLLVLFRENGACSWNGKRTESKGVSVVSGASSTPREGVYTWVKVKVLRVGGSVFRYTWDLESGGLLNFWTTDEEGGPCYGKKKTFSVAPKERTKKKSAWVSSHLAERARKESRQKKEATMKGC